MLMAELQTHHSMYMPNFIAAYIGTWYQFTIQIPADTKYIFFSSPVDRTIGLMKKAGTAHTFRTSIEGTVEVYGSETHHHKHLATSGSSFFMRTET